MGNCLVTMATTFMSLIDTNHCFVSLLDYLLIVYLLSFLSFPFLSSPAFLLHTPIAPIPMTGHEVGTSGLSRAKHLSLQRQWLGSNSQAECLPWQWPCLRHWHVWPGHYLLYRTGLQMPTWWVKEVWLDRTTACTEGYGAIFRAPMAFTGHLTCYLVRTYLSFGSIWVELPFEWSH